MTKRKEVSKGQLRQAERLAKDIFAFVARQPEAKDGVVAMLALTWVVRNAFVSTGETELIQAYAAALRVLHRGMDLYGTAAMDKLEPGHG